MAVRVGYQGNHGTFSEIAVLEYFKDAAKELCGCPDFPTILERCASGDLDYGVLPVENTTTGLIARSYDLFKLYPVHAVGEIVVPIREDCIGLAGADLSQVVEVYSHPEALSQCQSFFRSHPKMKAIAAQDTAAAVEAVKKSGDPKKAALASKQAGAYYGMMTLAASVQDSNTNMTRFLVVTSHDEQAGDADKISIMLTVDHTPGSLYHALGILAYNDINILKLESRPIPDEPFHYSFYIDFAGNLKDPVVQTALSKLREHSLDLRIFGAYKAFRGSF